MEEEIPWALPLWALLGTTLGCGEGVSDYIFIMTSLHVLLWQQAMDSQGPQNREEWPQLLEELCLPSASRPPIPHPSSQGAPGSFGLSSWAYTPGS